jgi:Family of unknown function (DUF6166)
MCEVNYYWGINDAEGVRVYKIPPDGPLVELPRPNRIVGRCDFPWEWGNKNRGAWLLAVALLLSAHSEWAAQYLAAEFMSQVVANLPAEWTMDSEQIDRWVRVTRHNIASVQEGSPNAR